MTALLSDDKQSHLSHIILRCIQKSPEVRMLGDQALALREIKRALAQEIALEQQIDQIVRTRLASYSRRILEGSQEWDVLYRKTYSEELRKRKLA